MSKIVSPEIVSPGRKPELVPPTDANIARAAVLLRAGGLVAFPTETVYGLGADATDARAVAAIFEAKGRPRFNPLIVHVPSRAAAERLLHLPEAGGRLAAAFWPGPLTLVAPMRADAGIADLATAGLPTLAVRVPAHPLALALLGAVGRPLAAPTANPSGRISPTTTDHVLDGLGGRIAAVLDGGPCEVGLESTIIGLAGGDPALLRPGGLPAEAAEAALGQRLAAPPGGISAPGQLASHYAPQARLRLDAATRLPGELWLGFGRCEGGARDGSGGDTTMNLSSTGDLHEAAANLFAHLRMLDARAGPGAAIAVAPIPRHGLGRAINDRLARAAAPREPSGD